MAPAIQQFVRGRLGPETADKLERRCAPGSDARGRRLPLRSALPLLASLLLLGGCAARPRSARRPWRSTLELPGGPLPFGLEVAEPQPRATTHPPVYILSGADHPKSSRSRFDGKGW